MKLGVPRATVEGEMRVALTPEGCAALRKGGFEVAVEAGAGRTAFFADEAYEKAGATIVGAAAELYERADVIVLVHAPGREEVDRLRWGQILLATLNPLTDHDLVRRLAEKGVTSLALDLMPRITRAQKMDVLSAMSTVAGYKAVLLAAAASPKMFPLLMTAAGTITPARVLVLGGGVAGLQAIATARRLGANVEALDVRPAVKEQVESLGARFVVVDAPQEDAQDAGGYAREMSAAYQQRQREVIGRHIRDSDVVISTALVPGRRAPILITTGMVREMKPGSVIVDLAGEAGGNCELTRPGETIVDGGVTIMAPRNLPATAAVDASQMYSRNMQALLVEIGPSGEIRLDKKNEILAGILVTADGQVVHPRVKALLGGGMTVEPARS